MKVRKQSLLYGILKPFIYIAARLLYRRWLVIGRQRFPLNGKPVVIVSNHQNALMDPLLCCLTAPRQVHFLTRADVFKSALARPFVFALNMMPVYRFRDKVSDMGKRNDKTFLTTIGRLKLGATIGIFPEGNHGARKLLRPVKKGIAYLLELGGNEHNLRGVQIVPVGVDYSHYHIARASLVVHYGQAFEVDDLLFSDEDRITRHKAVMERIREKLSCTMLDLGPAKLYPALRIAEMVMIEGKGYKEWIGIHDKLHAYRDELKLREVDQLLANAETLMAWTEEEKVDPKACVQHTMEVVPKHTFGSILELTLGLPAILFFALPWQLVLATVKKIVIDPHFNQTFRLVFALLYFPLFLAAGVCTLVFLTEGNYYLYFLITMVVSGIIALPGLDVAADIRRYKKARAAIDRASNLANWKSVVSHFQNELL
ncbi:MAG: 1-acyl-sn-glycerol-3-phosphate acyltransferase [Flavobacteriales bacterium]|nr:1-acyl-sn-glycerol-3-phosphate acyltransferase [Flavobacteriales bacterium]